MTPDYKERYSRQIRLSSIGESGQAMLAESHVVIIGCGALGSFQAGAMVRAGVGRVTLVDRDYVEVSNLQRQWLFDESDAERAMPKAVAAQRHLAAVNRACEVVAHVGDVSASTIDEVCEGATLLLDGTDNFETRYLLNDYSVARGIPWIYGAAVGTYGITMTVVPGQTCCFACVYPEPPSGAQATCETAGVLNTIPSLVASFQVAAATRLLVGGGVRPVITTVDAWDATVRQVKQPPPEPDCRCCGERRFSWLDPQRRTPVSLCGRNAVQIHDRSRPLDLAALAASLEHIGAVRSNEFALRLTVPPFEMTVFPDGRAIVKGTTDVALARSLYSRYIGN